MTIRTKQPWERGALSRGRGPRANVRLSPEEYELLRREAERRQTTVAALVRWAIHQMLNINEANKGGE